MNKEPHEMDNTVPPTSVREAFERAEKLLRESAEEFISVHAAAMRRKARGLKEDE